MFVLILEPCSNDRPKLQAVVYAYICNIVAMQHPICLVALDRLKKMILVLACEFANFGVPDFKGQH